MKEEQKQPAITYPFASGAGAATVSQTSVAAVSTTSAPQMNTFQFAAATSAAPPSCDNRPPGGEDVANALRALKQELSNLPHELKSELVHVQRVNSGLVNDSHLLGFLHAEEFRVDAALKRLVRYWKERYKLFGPDNYALPMTLYGAMKDSIHALKRGGFLHLLPVTDEAGRAIIYSVTREIHAADPSSEEKIKVWWYLLHVASQMPGVAQKGFVVLSDATGSRLNNFDTKWTLATCQSGDREFPIRWNMTHVCNAKVWPLVEASVKAFLTPKQRREFILHNGSNATVLENLARYMLPKQCLPTDLGGSLKVSADAFIEERLRVEKTYENETAKSAAVQDSNSTRKFAIASKDVFQGGSTLSSAEQIDFDTRLVYPYLEAGSSVQLDQINTSKIGTPKKIPSHQPKREGAASNNGNKKSAKKPQASKKEAKGKSSHPGRVGDPRMNLAVQAKMADPDLSLVAALIAGGFVFGPELNAPGVKVSTVKDVDGVTVYQRRNQLLRRMRLAKKGKGAKK